MHNKLLLVKAVGFDLDRTLYTDSPELTELMAKAVCQQALETKPELSQAGNVENFFRQEYEEKGNWSDVLRSAGFESPGPIVHSCLADLDVLSFIERDRELVELMQLLGARYFLFLITGSPKYFACSVLDKIGLNHQLFQFTLFCDDVKFIPKIKPNNFQYYLAHSHFSPYENVYVGDNPLTDILIPKLLGMRTIAVGRYIEEADLSVDTIHGIRPLLL